MNQATRTPLLVAAICGTVISVTLAQTSRPQSQDPNQQPTNQQDPNRRDTQRDTNQRDASQPYTRPALRNDEASRLMQRMQGVWNVDMRVDPASWKQMIGRTTTDDLNQRDSTRGTQEAGLTKTLRGTSEVKILLDGQVMQERCRISDGAGSMDKGLSGEFNKISLLTLEPNARTYEMALVSDCHDGMVLDRGSYTVQGDRLEFRCDPNSAMKNQQHASNFQPSRGVIEMLGDDSYRVTMYGASHTPGTSTNDSSRGDVKPGERILSITTHTRASGNEENSIRSRFDESTRPNR